MQRQCEAFAARVFARTELRLTKTAKSDKNGEKNSVLLKVNRYS